MARKSMKGGKNKVEPVVEPVDTVITENLSEEEMELDAKASELRQKRVDLAGYEGKLAAQKTLFESQAVPLRDKIKPLKQTIDEISSRIRELGLILYARAPERTALAGGMVKVKRFEVQERHWDPKIVNKWAEQNAPYLLEVHLNTDAFLAILDQKRELSFEGKVFATSKTVTEPRVEIGRK